jgi:hypothetical protein
MNLFCYILILSHYILTIMQELLKKLNIDETLTKSLKKPRGFTKVKDVTLPVGGYNYMSDLLYLPEDKKGNKYLLTMVDLWNNNIDFEPMKERTAQATLDAMQKIFKRQYLKVPKGSVSTDSGVEFQSVFHKWLYDKSIFHKISGVNRHSQMSSVENLNKQLGRLFNGYMNGKEAETGKVYKEWTDVLDLVRTELNKIKKHPTDLNPYTFIPPVPDFTVETKYKVGDFVFYALDSPQNALSQKQSGKFRMADYRYAKAPKKIIKVLHFPGKVPHRYMLDGIDNISFTERQLMKSDETEEVAEIKKIWEKKKQGNQILYHVWWLHEKKAASTWQTRKILLEDGQKDKIDEFEKSVKEKAKVKATKKATKAKK